MKRKGMRLLFLGDGKTMIISRKRRQDIFNFNNDVRH